MSFEAGDERPTETVSLAYSAFEQRYLLPGGTPTTATWVTAGFDLRTLKPVAFYNSCGG